MGLDSVSCIFLPKVVEVLLLGVEGGLKRGKVGGIVPRSSFIPLQQVFKKRHDLDIKEEREE